MAKYRYTGETAAYFPDLGMSLEPGQTVEIKEPPISAWLEPAADKTSTDKTSTDKGA